jgi:hypothetical protein
MLLVGMVELRSMILVNRPPWVSMPEGQGVTSSRMRSLTSPCRIPAWMAAPMPTTSSGLISWFGCRLKNSLTVFFTNGIRVWPPTRMISSICSGSRRAASRAFRQGVQRPFDQVPTRLSSWFRVSTT